MTKSDIIVASLGSLIIGASLWSFGFMVGTEYSNNYNQKLYKQSTEIRTLEIGVVKQEDAQHCVNTILQSCGNDCLEKVQKVLEKKKNHD